jgi:hypothetical protein
VVTEIQNLLTEQALASILVARILNGPSIEFSTVSVVSGLPGVVRKSSKVYAGHLSDRVGREWVWTTGNFAFVFSCLLLWHRDGGGDPRRRRRPLDHRPATASAIMRLPFDAARCGPPQAGRPFVSTAVVGETPNLAARLQALAQPNQIVVSAATRGIRESTDSKSSIRAHGGTTATHPSPPILERKDGRRLWGRKRRLFTAHAESGHSTVMQATSSMQLGSRYHIRAAVRVLQPGGPRHRVTL